MTAPVLIAPYNLVVTYFNDKTFAEWKSSGESKLLSDKNFKSVKVGSIVLLVNVDQKKLVGVAKTVNAFQERHLLDPAVYTVEDSKYNRYEVGVVSKILPCPMPLSDVATWCGIPDGDKTRNNISKCTPMQFAPAFYKGDNESAIIKRLYNLTVNML